MTDQSFMPDLPEASTKAKKRKKKPFEVWFRDDNWGWARWGRYASVEIAENVIALQERKQERFSDKLKWEFKVESK